MEYMDENIPTSCRVKLYLLESEGNWIDQGTGFVSCLPLHAQEGPSMVISREEDGAHLLQSRIVLDDVYERQGESIIMWRETGEGWGQDVDYAISFQDSSGCFSVWEYICYVREHFRSDDESYFEEQHPMLRRSTRISAFRLPSVSPETLPDIIDQFAACSSNSQQKRMVAQYIVGQNFQLVQDLVKLSSDLALKEDFSACGRVSDVMKQIAYLNDSDIINYLVSDNIFLLVAGVWEYDASLRYKESYRAFLTSPVATPRHALSGQSFSDGDEVIDFLSTKLFRLRYMKDAMLRPLIDEGGAGALSNAVQMTTAELCERLFADHAYAKAVLAVIEQVGVAAPIASADTAGHTHSQHQTTTNVISPREAPEQDGSLRRGSSGVSISTLSTVSDSPSPVVMGDGTLQASSADGNISEVALGVTTTVSSSVSINGNNEIGPQNGDASVETISESMQRMMVASSSSAPVDNQASLPDTRGACLKFLRELFGLSRNLSFDKRSELYAMYLDGVRSAFFNAMLEVMRCGPSIEWISSMTSESSNNRINNSNYSAAGTTRKQFCALQEDRESETFHRLCAIEILSTLTCICPNAFRSFVLEGPMPKPILPGQLFGGLGVVRQYNDINDIEKYPYKCDESERVAQIVQSMRKHNSKCLLYVIIARLLAETNEMIMEHIGDILHSILDPECRTDTVVDRERFAVAVNDCYLPWLVVCFLEHFRDHSSCRNSNFSGNLITSASMRPYLNSTVYYSSVRVISEALCFCCNALGYRIKYFILRNQLVSKVLTVLLGSGQKVVYLHAIKFVFAIVKTKDDMNFKQWAKMDVLKPLFELLVSLSSKDNLLLSAIIELMDFIRAENIKTLIEYIVEKHAHSFANVVYQGETFEKLSNKYAQIKDAEDEINNRGPSGFPQNFRDSVESSRRVKYNTRDAEESYFQDDDEPDNDEDMEQIAARAIAEGPASNPLALLQSYSGDEDDEEMGPKPLAVSLSSDTADECNISDDMFSDDINVTNSGADKKNKKRRLSSIGGYATNGRPDKVRALIRDAADSESIFPGVGVYISAVLDSEEKSSGILPAIAVPSVIIADTVPLVPVGLSVDEDVSPPLPPLRSKYDSSSDEEEAANTSGDKNFLSTLFRRNPSGSSATRADASTSEKSQSAEV